MTKLDSSVAEGESFLSVDDEHIVRSLQMAIAQIDMSIEESGLSMATALETLRDASTGVFAVATSLEDCPGELNESATNNLNEVNQQLLKTIIAFQFFDRLTQRLSHIQDNLSSVSWLIQEPTQEHPQLWQQLEEKMRKVYSEDQALKLNRILSDHKKGKATQDDVTSGSGSAPGSAELF